MKEYSKIAQQIKDAIAKLDNTSETKRINDLYDGKIAKLNDERKNKLDGLKDTSAERKKLEKALALLDETDSDSDVVTPVKSIPTKESKAVTVVGSYIEANTNDKKVLFALSQIGSGTKEAIIDKLVELDSTINASAIQQIPSALKSKGVIKSIGKEGKKDIYSI